MTEAVVYAIHPVMECEPCDGTGLMGAHGCEDCKGTGVRVEVAK